MKALEALYWLRFFLGIVAAIICIGYGLATNTLVKGWSPNVFINGFAWAVIVYTLSYYIIKPRLLLKVEKPQKILTTGIFLYFLSWLFFWILLYTIISA
ncbi:MAG: hypothetical protein RMJ15_03715 [Nitrososphaerota archaeon]|nr:hypothetical protein [Candidatus Bathyarchaeota archaeon]MDW8022834.1 hypothetical protein [Nitrososphaerota archaeon]